MATQRDFVDYVAEQLALGARLTGHLPDWVLRIALSLVMLNAAWLLWMKT